MTQPSTSLPAGGGAPVLCPKCGSQMLPVQRFGVEIDQCTGCGGIFLDRGELEVLVQAESRFYAAAQPPPAPPQQYVPPQQYPQPTYQQGGFLGGLFGDSHQRRRYGHH
ncbi:MULTISPECIES: TFIIB-type zinc ribbon-containing protein [Mycobacterium]|uniref:TFIIB-type zinc ribbon-containing protein n=1 Tax=Mycobacterium TaxID=1763 RepID=UPI0009EDF56E